MNLLKSLRGAAVLLAGIAVLSACQNASISTSTESGVAVATTATTGATPAATEDAETAADFSAASGELVIYSGRTESLIGPLIEEFEEASGLDVKIRYGNTAEMAATILEEGNNSPADVYFAQDAGAMGALAADGRLAALPESIVDKVDARYRGPNGDWVGVSGRARTLVYNTAVLQESRFAVERFRVDGAAVGRTSGLGATNGSFQAFVTAMRKLHGDDVTRQWLEDMVANDVQSYENNTNIVEAVGRGEVDAGLVNHYYLYRFLDEQGESFPARNYHFPDRGADALVNVAGVGLINTSQHQAAALQFIEVLLDTEAQQYFADETVEYPLAGDDVKTDPLLPPLAELNPPDIDLGDLTDLQGHSTCCATRAPCSRSNTPNSASWFGVTLLVG
ncbi:MAG: iron ABC transporter substrate-binding protein [Anaerolineales bacterium]|nr:iron ABC transporter substrate-binding protein [Anaerolineales bacterium]